MGIPFLNSMGYFTSSVQFVPKDVFGDSVSVECTLSIVESGTFRVCCDLPFLERREEIVCVLWRVERREERRGERRERARVYVSFMPAISVISMISLVVVSVSVVVSVISYIHTYLPSRSAPSKPKSPNTR